MKLELLGFRNDIISPLLIIAQARAGPRGADEGRSYRLPPFIFLQYKYIFALFEIDWNHGKPYCIYSYIGPQ